MKFVRSLFIVFSFVAFAGFMTSCEEEEILTTQTDGDPIQDVGDIDD